MATRVINKITGITGVIQGAVATVKLEVGPRYHAVKLTTKINGARVAATDLIDSIKIKVNEKVIRDLTAAQVIAINKLNGITTTLGDFGIFFSEPGRADKVDEEATAWQTLGERSFKIELKLKVLALPGDIPLIEGEAIYDYDQPRYAKDHPTKAGLLVKNVVRHTSQSHALAAGWNNITTLETEAPILRILLDGAQVISEVQAKADKLIVHESGVFENLRRLQDYGMDGTAFKYPLCFDYTERLDHYLVVGALNLRVNSAAAQDAVSVTESITDGFN
jgi:hypothetical protein